MVGKNDALTVLRPLAVVAESQRYVFLRLYFILIFPYRQKIGRSIPFYLIKLISPQ